jgi:hypothetical protein
MVRHGWHEGDPNDTKDDFLRNEAKLPHMAAGGLVRSQFDSVVGSRYHAAGWRVS